MVEAELRIVQGQGAKSTLSAEACPRNDKGQMISSMTKNEERAASDSPGGVLSNALTSKWLDHPIAAYRVGQTTPKAHRGGSKRGFVRPLYQRLVGPYFPLRVRRPVPVSVSV